MNNTERDRSAQLNGASQESLITWHVQLTEDARNADPYRQGHYEHLLLALCRLIESHGPTEAYREWISSTSST